jgi:hypothetical protein
MVAKMRKQVGEVLGEYGGLSRKVLEYSLIMKQMVDAAKKPGFSESSWAPLAALVAVEEFRRVGNFLELMTWPEYVAFLTRWAQSSEWECSFKRVSQSDNVVFLELEERSRVGDHASVVNSSTVYEFNADGKLAHLDIYLQMKPMPAEMLKSYA